MNGPWWAPRNGSYNHHCDRSFIPKMDACKGASLRDSLRTLPGLLVPCQDGGGARGRRRSSHEDQCPRIKGHSSANNFCSKPAGQARAGEPREGKQADWGHCATHRLGSACSWHAFGLRTPAVTAAMQLPSCVSEGAGMGSREGKRPR